jgi:hypothetical protein
MKDKVQIDTGRDILTLEANVTLNAKIVTAYVNGISIRCGSLQLARVADAFADTVVAACAMCVDSSWLKKQIEEFINNSTH